MDETLLALFKATHLGLVAATNDKADTVVISTNAFDDSLGDLIMLGTAIKYLNNHDKNVTIVTT